LGWLSSARQVAASAISPFILALGMGSVGVFSSLVALLALGALGVLVFAAVAVHAARRRAIGLAVEA
jgi:hypothetical protein